MKILKNLIVILLVLIMFSACGQSAQSTSDETTIVETTEVLIDSSEWFVTDEKPSQFTDETYPPRIEPPTEETEPPTEPLTEAPTDPKPTPTNPPTTVPMETEPEPTIVVPPTIESPGVETGFVEIDPYEIAPNGMTNRELLACVIYQEAGWDKSCDQCRFRVADVVLNRVSCSSFPNTLYGVLTQKSQYGRYYWTGVVWASGYQNDPEGVQRAYDVADAIFSGQHSEVYGENYVWQAEFPQGHSNFKCCGTYYGQHSH